MDALDERQAVIREAVERFTAAVRLALLRVFMAPPERRAGAIGRLYEMTDGAAIAELLIGLEEDRLVAMEVADALKGSLPDR